MTDTPHPFPAADPECRLEARGSASDGTVVEVVLGERELRVGDVSLPLDDALRATLGWTDATRGEDSELVLELSSVSSATRRRRVSLATSLGALGDGFRDVEALRCVRSTAVRVGGPEMRRILARVRAVLEACHGTATWVPRGDLELALPNPGFRSLAATDLEPRPSDGTPASWELVAGAEDLAVIRPASVLRRINDGGIHVLMSVGGSVLLAGVLALLAWFGGVLAVGASSPTILVLAFLFGLGLALWSERGALRSGVRIEPDALHLPGRRRAIPRRNITALRPTQDGALEIVLDRGAVVRFECRGDARYLARLIELAWRWQPDADEVAVADS